MSKELENENRKSENGQPSLDFKEATSLTIEEAVRKDSDLKAGITENDGVLDKYIKKHRDDILSQKFETTSKDFESLDTSTLDDFIQKQRQEINDEVLEDNTETLQSSTIFKDSTIKENGKSNEEVEPFIQEVDNNFYDPNNEVELTYVEEVEEKRKKPWWIAILLLFLAALLSIAYWMNYKKTSHVSDTTSSSSSVTKSSSTESDDTEMLSEFNSLYDKFFVDAEKTKLKNSEFDNLPQLEAILKKMKQNSSSHYKEYKAKYDSLSKQIAAIKSVNDKYESDAIVNGEIVTSSLKDGSNLDDLSSETLNTGNATLDNLIQSVISSEKGQGTAVVSPIQSIGNEVVGTETTTATESSSSNISAPSAQISTSNQSVESVISQNGSFGLSSATNLQRTLSRVPYNYNLIADSSNSAWNFNPGVLEKIIQVSHERGYFSGNDYILEPVNIINGNGYYNMFKSDGTYLFSINCKTGYFVGNAAGHADSLDY